MLEEAACTNPDSDEISKMMLSAGFAPPAIETLRRRYCSSLTLSACLSRSRSRYVARNIYIYKYINIHIDVFVQIQISINSCIFIYGYICRYVYISIWMFIRMYKYIFFHIYLYKYIYIYLYIYIYIYIYVYIYTCINGNTNICRTRNSIYYLYVTYQLCHITSSRVTHVNESHHTCK